MNLIKKAWFDVRSLGAIILFALGSPFIVVGVAIIMGGYIAFPKESWVEKEINYTEGVRQWSK